MKHLETINVLKLALEALNEYDERGHSDLEDEAYDYIIYAADLMLHNCPWLETKQGD